MTTRRTAALLVSCTLAALAGCASSSTGGSAAARDGVTGDAILTLEDARGDRSARETLTMLNLPLPGLGGADTEPVEWSQLETRGTADWATSPVSIDSRRGLALVAGEEGVTLVRTRGSIERVGETVTGHAIASVSLAPSGMGVALSEDGTTLHLLNTSDDALTHEGAFPLAMTLGEGAHAGVALLNQHNQLAILDEGRSRVAMMRLSRTDDGAISLEALWEQPTGDGPVAGAWTSDGRTLVVAEKMLSDELASELEILAASGRVSFFPSNAGDPTRVMLPGRPTAMTVSPDGSRVGVVLDRREGPTLALVMNGRSGAALLDSTRIGEPAAGVAFDTRGRHLLVALPEVGALGVWAVEGTTLRDTDMRVETGPGVSAVAIAGD